MTTYTEKLDNQLWEMDDYHQGLDFLNGTEFRSFGDGLSEIIKLKMPENSNDTPLNYLKQKCQSCGISIADIASNSTLRNWFGGKPRPDKSEDNRQAMFLIAFALGLSIDEAATLFANVYLDRPFNLRSPREYIYRYCLENSLPYQRAQAVLEQVSLDNNGKDTTVLTQFLSKQMLLHKNEQEVVSFINNNPHNFALNNITGKKLVQDLLEKAKICAAKECHKDSISINLLYETITGQTVSTRRGTTTIFRNNRLPKEIRNRFPQPVSFSKSDPTSEELRKMIILLASYPIWYEMENNESGVVPDWDEYCEEINDHLVESGYPELYAGNPFDWLFLFCAKEDRPLDMFRDLIDEVEHAGE